MGHLHLPGLAGKVSYAQLLNDGSELPLEHLDGSEAEHGQMSPRSHDTVSIRLPIRRPDVLVPVIELFLTAD
jgi:alpha-L-fucosidase